MNKKILVAVMAMIPVMAIASFSDRAQVKEVSPKYTYKVVSEPYQDCEIRDVYETLPYGSGGATNQLAGGILGGLIGNQFGGGDGKKAMTIAGALLGASMSGGHQKVTTRETREVCQTRYREEEIRMLSHYNVTVIYNDHEVTFRSKKRPYGGTVNVKVDVRPNF
jgi:uncharacterized protein YcfJ